MIGANRAVHLKRHVSEVFLIQAAPATRAAIVITLPRDDNQRAGNRLPESLPLPLNQLLRSSTGCTFSAHSQAKPIAIGCKSSGAVCFMYFKLREVIPMKLVSFVRLACQHSTHAPLYFLGQWPIEMRINTSHRQQRVATDLSIIDIANAMVCQSTSLLQEPIQCFRPVVDSLAANRLWVDRIAKYAPKNRDQAGYRSHRIERRPVGLNEQRIRIHSQQSW